jgi:hypothetical protein
LKEKNYHVVIARAGRIHFDIPPIGGGASSDWPVYVRVEAGRAASAKRSGEHKYPAYVTLIEGSFWVVGRRDAPDQACSLACEIKRRILRVGLHLESMILTGW